MASLPLALVLERINIGDMGHVCLVLSGLMQCEHHPCTAGVLAGLGSSPSTTAFSKLVQQTGASPNHSPLSRASFWLVKR